MKPKKIAQALSITEGFLWIAALLGIKAAHMQFEEKGLLIFLIMATYAALVPVTLAFLCEGMRYLIKKQMESENDPTH
ncbi:MAG: hypothetical protein COA91_13690 [Robiginitomaculum sp.]|nr:MAG: hypothetical protein COA91_13690 [Robiginitomaculum sp.]